MEDQSTILDKTIETSGDRHRYQYLIMILATVIWINAELITFSIPYLEKQPEISYIDPISKEYITTQLNYTICKNKDISYTKTKVYGHSWVSEFGIECSQSKNDLLGTLLFIGTTLGIILLFGFGFGLSSLVLLINTYWSVVLSQFLFGLCHTCCLILRYSLISEITKKNYRSYALSMMICAGSISTIVGYPLFTNKIPWRFIYFINAGIIILGSAAFYLFSIESLRVTISKGNFKELINSVKYLKKINGISDENFSELIGYIEMYSDNIIRNKQDVEVLSNHEALISYESETSSDKIVSDKDKINQVNSTIEVLELNNKSNIIRILIKTRQTFS